MPDDIDIYRSMYSHYIIDIEDKDSTIKIRLTKAELEDFFRLIKDVLND